MRVVLIILIFMSLSHARNNQKDPVISLLPKLENLVQKAMHKRKVPGMAVAVVSKGKIIYIKGFGVRAIGRPEPVTSKTLFQLGSISKAISSTLIAILNREQEISLDHPIEPIPGATLRHILSHTTGMPSAGFNELIERGGSPLEAQKELLKITLEEEPGKKFAYHNVVYNLLTHIIEAKSGASFEFVLQEKLLKPLGMENTSSTWKAFVLEENRVTIHVAKKAKGKTKGKKKGKIIKVVNQPAPYRKEYANFPAAGGFSSNIHDMALFLSAVMGARPDVVSLQDLEEFIRPVIHTPDQWYRTTKHRDRITQTQYALGWRHMTFANHPIVFHGGMLRGFSTMLAFLPDQQVGIIILQNANSSLASQISMQFFDWVLGLPFKQWID
jgi:beta-lactamase class C